MLSLMSMINNFKAFLATVTYVFTKVHIEVSDYVYIFKRLIDRFVLQVDDLLGDIMHLDEVETKSREDSDTTNKVITVTKVVRTE